MKCAVANPASTRGAIITARSRSTSSWMARSWFCWTSLLACSRRRILMAKPVAPKNSPRKGTRYGVSDWTLMWRPHPLEASMEPPTYLALPSPSHPLPTSADAGGLAPTDPRIVSEERHVRGADSRCRSSAHDRGIAAPEPLGPARGLPVVEAAQSSARRRRVTRRPAH